MKTLAIVGAGPGLGLSLAKTFGQQDYRIALIARSQEKLDSYVQQLQDLHIEAAGIRFGTCERDPWSGGHARI